MKSLGSLVCDKIVLIHGFTNHDNEYINGNVLVELNVFVC